MSDEDLARETNASPNDSLAGMLASLFKDAEILLLQELTLLRAEIAQQFRLLFRGTLSILAGVAIMLAGGMAVVAAAILALGSVVPYWAASLIVGIGMAAIGGMFVLFGRSQVRRADFVPRRTWQSLRESGEWLRDEFL
jgi:hypothetical protein